MVSLGELLKRGPTESPKDFVEKVRRLKFRVGTGATSTLAPDLHRTIKQLSVELYQDDVHFIKEIVQNAEDNNYSEAVIPSLEFQLIEEDIAEVGASTTLVILNNELGLLSEDVVALSSAGKSTKIGRRNKGYIGCKGIGFKSVFMICESPLIISNGYRIRFQAEPTKEAGVGYIVPEWVESPSNEKILSAIGGDEMPTTVIILPILEAKIELVRRQLKELSPEIILFLTRIRELNVVDKTKHAVGSIDLLKIKRSTPISGIRSNVCRFFEVTLSVEKSAGTVPSTFAYFIFQRAYPVTRPVQERKEIHEWTVTLAFPREGRPPSGHVGDVFSFLPTQLRTGFPFLVHADFLLTTSRETIRFDSPWNVGILECIPAAFDLSFKIMLKRTYVLPPQEITLNFEALSRWDWKDAYRYLPRNTLSDAYRLNSDGAKEVRQVRQKLSVEPQQGANLRQLDMVRANILNKLEKQSLVALCTLSVSKSDTVYCRHAKRCMQIMSSFRDILEEAALHNHPSPTAVTILPDGTQNPRKSFSIVDKQIQKKYASGLAALGVPEMTTSQYMSFLRDSEWLLSLPETLYFEVVTFFAYKLTILEESVASRELIEIKYLKIKDENGTVELASFSELRGSEVIYTCDEGVAEWISAWANVFKPWHVVRVLPTETAQALKAASNSRELIEWINRHASLTELNVLRFAKELIEKLVVPRTTTNHVDTMFSLLVLQFLYSGIRKSYLLSRQVIHSLQSEGYVSVVENNVGRETRSASIKLREGGGVLLPRSASKWPLLFSISARHFRFVTELSDRYLEPQCSLVRNVVTKSNGPDSMLYFLKQAFNAVDIPHVKLPANIDFPLHRPVTMEKSVLCVQWLRVFLPNRRITKLERDNDRLLTSLKALDWVKTCYHGWQSPGYVIFPISDFEDHFTAHDIPLLDVSAYSLDLTNSEIQVVLEELGIVTDIRNGGATVAKYFFSRSATELDPEAVKRFYEFFNEVEWERDEVVQNLTVWTPSTGTRSHPMWRTPSECIICDEHKIFEDSEDVTILDEIYDDSLLPFFSDKLHVPKTASVNLYCKIWLKWSNSSSVLNEEQPMSQTLSLLKVRIVWKSILDGWEECSEAHRKSFSSSAWVPVAPPSNDELMGEIISIVPPNKALIADDLALSESFAEVADGNLNFAWLLPGLSAKQAECLVKLYSEMGVRRLSKLVNLEVQIPPNVWKKRVPWGKGLICEGLFRSVLAYLCKSGVNSKRRQQILARLISVTEVVVSEPFEICSSLHVETLTSPATITKKVNFHYDNAKDKVYRLETEHSILDDDMARRDFHANLVTVVSHGILSRHPKLVQGLTSLLKLLCHSGFAMKYVEYELQAHKLLIFPEDEKLLAEKLAIRQQPKRRSTTLRKG